MTTIREIREEIRRLQNDADGLTLTDLDTITSGATAEINFEDGSKAQLSTILAQLRSQIASGTPLAPGAATEEQLQALQAQIQGATSEVFLGQEEVARLQAELNQAGLAPARKDEIKRQLAEAQGRVVVMQQHMQRLVGQAQAHARVLGQELPTQFYEAAGLPPPNEGQSNVTLQMKAMTGGGNGAGQPGAQGKAVGGMSFTAPQLGAAQTSEYLFSTDTFMKANMMDDFVLNSFDDVMKNQNRGKQLMMLFFYFAKRAESGDMGQMYQFMKFITYIISKDKAKQQIDMGRKLIELQDESRKVTDTLLNQKTDANDPNSNNEFMKTMTWSKSQSDAIATSQKLIAQMMEEMAQVVETLTNVTKSALDSHKKIQSVVSSTR